MWTKRLLALTLFAALAAMPTCALRAQWVQTNGPYGGDVYAFAKNSTYLFAATNGGVYRSGDGGTTWVIENNGMISNNPVLSLATMGTLLFAGTEYYGVFRSTDNGMHWSEIDSSTYPNGLSGAGPVQTMTTSGTNLYVGIWGGGVFRSSDSGTGSWVSTSPKSTGSYITALASSGIYIFLGIDGTGSGESGGGFRSSDNGEHWASVSVELTNTTVSAIAADSGANVYLCTSDTLFRSTDHGVSWTEASAKLPGQYVHSIIISGSNLFVSMYYTGVFRSTDNGTSWTSSSTGITNLNVLALCTIGTVILAGTAGSGVFETIDSGTRWTATGHGIANTSITGLTANGGDLFAFVDGLGFFRTTDDGASWTPAGLTNNHVYSLSNLGQILFAGTDSGIFRSTDNGTNWTLANSGITGQFTWVQTFGTIGTDIFAGTNDFPVFRSTDSGTSWTPVGYGIESEFSSLAVLGTQLFIGTYDQGIFKSTDRGETWALTSNGLTAGYSTPYPKILSIVSFGTTIFESGDGVFRSTDSGTSWTSAAAGISGDIGQLVTFDSYLFLSDGYGGVNFSTDAGMSWEYDTVGLMNNDVVALAVSGNNLFAATGNGVWRSSTTPPYILGANADTLDFGTIPAGSSALRIDTVNNVGNLPLTIQSFQLTQSQNVFATSDLSSEVSLQPGEHFTFEAYFNPIEPGVYTANLAVVSEAKIVNLTFIGTATGTAGIEQQSQSYAILYAFPNPFSQSTQISLTSVSAGYADISIVNLLGEQIAHLFSGQLDAGQHNFTFSNIAGLPDGAYECLVRMNGHVEKQPIILLH